MYFIVVFSRSYIVSVDGHTFPFSYVFHNIFLSFCHSRIYCMHLLHSSLHVKVCLSMTCVDRRPLLVLIIFSFLIIFTSLDRRNVVRLCCVCLVLRHVVYIQSNTVSVAANQQVFVMEEF